MPQKSQDNFSTQWKLLHEALVGIVSAMNRPQRDEVLIKAAGIRLDRALFPLLVIIDRFGPIAVGDLADRVGRGYTTVSRHVTKLESLQLAKSQGSTSDGRVRETSISGKGKAMIATLDAAREKLAREVLKSWNARDLQDLVSLMGRFAEAFERPPPEP